MAALNLKSRLLEVQQTLVAAEVEVSPAPVVAGWEIALIGGELCLTNNRAPAVTIETANKAQRMQMLLKVRQLLTQIPEAE